MADATGWTNAETGDGADGAGRPLFSCIVTACDEGDAVSLSLASLAAQSFTCFEVIVVENGATPRTRAAIDGFLAERSDPRFRVIRQSTECQSAARNMAMRHARGDYVCFLDGDDSRPPWAFESLAAMLGQRAVDVVFCRGVLSGSRGELGPFDDEAKFDELLYRMNGLNHRAVSEPRFRELLSFLMLIEPQAANKVVSRAFIRDFNLAFPNGQIFSDVLFHVAVVAALKSFAVVDDPCFTRYVRQGDAFTATGSGDLLMDSIGVAKLCLETFAVSPRFHDPAMRASLMLALFHLLEQCETGISHLVRNEFHELLILLTGSMDPLYLRAVETCSPATPAETRALEFIRTLSREADARLARA